jgi:hypothetical protein
MSAPKPLYLVAYLAVVLAGFLFFTVVLPWLVLSLIGGIQ